MLDESAFTTSDKIEKLAVLNRTEKTHIRKTVQTYGYIALHRNEHVQMALHLDSVWIELGLLSFYLYG